MRTARIPPLRAIVYLVVLILGVVLIYFGPRALWQKAAYSEDQVLSSFTANGVERHHLVIWLTKRAEFLPGPNIVLLKFNQDGMLLQRDELDVIYPNASVSGVTLNPRAQESAAIRAEIRRRARMNGELP